MRSSTFSLGLALLALFSSPGWVAAHFPWLTVDQDQKAILFFSESIHERNYHTPAAVANAQVHALVDGNQQLVDLAEVSEENFDGRQANEPFASDSSMNSVIQYGIYHGTLLRYSAKHQPLGAEPAKSGLPIEAVLRSTDTGVAVHVTWQGQPLADAEVSLTDSQAEAHKASTDPQGIARFDNLPAGELGLVVGKTAPGKGSFQDQPYTSESFYLTLTSQITSGGEAAAEPTMHSDFPPMLDAVASFGAAVADGYLYVYSGHCGEEHAHSRDNLSQHFSRLKLDGGQSWEPLPLQAPLQGMPLVAHGGKLYLVGGLNHRNAADEDPDMHSTDAFASYDPATGQWTQLPELPQPRSSHDAVVIGDRLYVVGGWTLAGEGPGEWLTDALVYDFTAPAAGWQTIAPPKRLRRALALAHLDGHVVALGGFQNEGGVTNAVSAYNPETNAWTDLPELPTGDDEYGIAGFGISAWTHDGVLYFSGAEGVVYALSPGAKQWTKAAELKDPRFFHRLLPGTNGTLLIVAGASTEHGHVGTIETVDLSHSPVQPSNRPPLEEF